VASWEGKGQRFFPPSKGVVRGWRSPGVGKAQVGSAVQQQRDKSENAQVVAGKGGARRVNVRGRNRPHACNLRTRPSAGGAAL